MAKRMILAAMLGGLAIFLWEFVAHELLPLGEAGLKALDNEQLTTALRASVKEPGFYMFPMADETGMTAAQKQAAMQQSMEKMKSEPTGLMVISPQGREFVMGPHLAIQFVTDVLEMLLAAVLVGWATMLKGYGGRVLFVTLLGLLPTLGVGLPFWNWYGFPTTYVMAQALISLVGYLAGGLVVAWLVRPRVAG